MLSKSMCGAGLDHLVVSRWCREDRDRVPLGGKAAARPAKPLVLLIPFFSPTVQ